MAAETEMKAHERTYGSFLSLFRYGMVGVGIVVVVVILLIAR